MFEEQIPASHNLFPVNFQDNPRGIFLQQDGVSLLVQRGLLLVILSFSFGRIFLNPDWII
jgi:hypothetical protein